MGHQAFLVKFVEVVAAKFPVVGTIFQHMVDDQSTESGPRPRSHASCRGGQPDGGIGPGNRSLFSEWRPRPTETRAVRSQRLPLVVLPLLRLPALSLLPGQTPAQDARWCCRRKDVHVGTRSPPPRFGRTVGQSPAGSPPWLWPGRKGGSPPQCAG